MKQRCISFWLIGVFTITTASCVSLRTTEITPASTLPATVQPTETHTPPPSEIIPTQLILLQDLTNHVLVLGRSKLDKKEGVHYVVNLETGEETYLEFVNQDERAAMWDSRTGWVYFPSLRQVNLFTGEVRDILGDLGILKESDSLNANPEWLNLGNWVGIWKLPEVEESKSLSIYSVEESSLLFEVAGLQSDSIEDAASSRHLLASIVEHPNWQDYPNTTYPSDIYVVEVNSGDFIFETDDEPGQLTASWSPSGEFLAVVSSYYGTLAGDGPINGEFLEIWDVDNRIISYRFVGHYDQNDETDSDGPSSFAEIQWSRDGSFIVFTDVDWNGRFVSDICVLKLESGVIDCPTLQFENGSASYYNSPRILNDNLLVFLETDLDSGCLNIVTTSIIEPEPILLDTDLCIFASILPDLATK